MIKNTSLTRRAALGVGAVGAATLLAGCTSGSNKASSSSATSSSSSVPSKSFEELTSTYLPLGSVVQLKGFADHVAFVIVARRPAVDSEDEGYVPDYAGVFYPFGFFSFTKERQEDLESEVIIFDTSDIEAVLHIGMQDPMEKEAVAELEQGKGTDQTSATLLLPLMDSYFNINSVLNVASVEEEVDEQ